MYMCCRPIANLDHLNLYLSNNLSLAGPIWTGFSSMAWCKTILRHSVVTRVWSMFSTAEVVQSAMYSSKNKTYNRVEKFSIIALCSAQHKNHFQVRKLNRLQKVLATHMLVAITASFSVRHGL